MKEVSVAALAAISTLAVASPALASDASAAKPSSRAIVMVSGGAAISPFTTPKSACKAGFAAGVTDTQIRAFFLKKGYQVFTAPATGGRGKVAEDTNVNGFSKCPKALPRPAARVLALRRGPAIHRQTLVLRAGRVASGEQNLPYE